MTTRAEMSGRKAEGHGAPAGQSVRNNVRELMDQGRCARILAVRLIKSAEIVPIAIAAGFDSLYLDLEHSTISMSEASQICIAALASGIAPFVRVAAPAEEAIAQALDAGALGVIIPQLSSAQDVRDAVAASRFPPAGRRSVSTSSPQLGYRPVGIGSAIGILNAATVVAPMIETLGALDEVEEIVSIDGVDMLFVGANDLTTALGIPGDYTHETARAAFRRILAAARAAGTHVGFGGIPSTGSLAAELIEEGAVYLSVGTDQGLLMNGARRALSDLGRAGT